MSATRPRRFRCSGSASRCGRSTPCSSPTTPATAPGRGRVFDGAADHRGRAGDRGARGAGALRRRALGLHGLGRDRRRDPRRGRAGEGARTRRALYCCDPVIGDVGRGVFVRPGIPEFMREHAVPAADVVTPNQFELDFCPAEQRDAARGARGDRRGARARAARRCWSPRCTPTRRRPTRSTSSPPTAAGRFRVRTPRLPIAVNGAGDADRGAVLRALPARRLGRRGAGARRVLGVRRAQAHGRRRARARSC